MVDGIGAARRQLMRHIRINCGGIFPATIMSALAGAMGELALAVGAAGTAAIASVMASIGSVVVVMVAAGAIITAAAVIVDHWIWGVYIVLKADIPY